MSVATPLLYRPSSLQFQKICSD